MKCEFLADITAHLNALNVQLQGRHHMITDMYDAVKLLLWEKLFDQMSEEQRKLNDLNSYCWKKNTFYVYFQVF